MNWFNIVFVLVAQALLFFFISQMYERNNRLFSAFKGLFLILSFFNVVVVLFMSFFISLGSDFKVFNGFSVILFTIQMGVLVVVIISYAVNYVVVAVNVKK